MKLNRKWINEEFVDLSQVSDQEFVETMTLAGQKVETYERLDGELRNVVVGKVLSMVRHPNSDHMWICQVDVGREEPVQIVTGAQNVRDGDLVPAALHNSWLPGGVHITKGKLRGETSNGMLCSLKELGLTLNDFPYAIEDGIWILEEDCKPGDDINTVPIATPSSAWLGRPPPPFTVPCATMNPWFTAAQQGPCMISWTWRFRRSICATGTPPGW